MNSMTTPLNRFLDRSGRLGSYAAGSPRSLGSRRSSLSDSRHHARCVEVTGSRGTVAVEDSGCLAGDRHDSIVPDRSMLAIRASTPAPPASANAAAGPARSARTPALAAPAAPPTAIAVASHANASVMVPCGVALPTIVYKVASVGAIVAPATSSTAPSASALPSAGISARCAPVSAPRRSARPVAVRAPPPSLAKNRPPRNDPVPQRRTKGRLPNRCAALWLPR